MKKYLFVVCLITTCLSSLAQWGLNGKNILPGQFIGTLNNSPLVFTTNGVSPAAERMRLTPAGSLGINTTNPLSMFHMSQGAFLLDGNLGVNPNATLVSPA